jgi:fatty acid-binding protein DegV
MTGPVAVVTDSTACLPADVTGPLGIAVVPLRVVAGRVSADDEPGVLDGPIGAELRRGRRLSTARPAPAAFAASYAAAAAAGARAVVSVHLSGRLSGTIRSAQLAASGAAVPVRVVDSLSIGMGLGFAVLAAARSAAAGRQADAVAAAASACAVRVGSFVALDSTEYLAAGGRLDAGGGVGAGGLDAGGGLGAGGLDAGGGMGAGGLGAGGGLDSAAGRTLVLTARPLLHIRDGRIGVLDRVRTRSAALTRLSELAVEFAAGRPVDLAVQYLGAAERAATLARRLAEAIPAAPPASVAEAGAAILAHTGPGMLGVVVSLC